jgi:hypothetical protein
MDHEENPYPSREIKKTLSAQTNLSISDISTWFNNERTRIKRATKKVSSKRMFKNDKDILNNFYHNVNKYPNNNELESLSEMTGLTINKIIYWFKTKHRSLIEEIDL